VWNGRKEGGESREGRKEGRGGKQETRRCRSKVRRTHTEEASGFGRQAATACLE